MFGKPKNDSPTCTRWEDMPQVECAAPPDEMLPDIPRDSTWEFRTHQGRVHTFTGTRLGSDGNQYTIVKVLDNYWGPSISGTGWYPEETVEIIGGINKGSVETWRKLDAVVPTPETV